MGEQVLRMAHHLRSPGLPPGSHVALMSKNCAEWILADLSIWAAGHVSVPLYPNLTSTTVRQILEHSESRLLFVGKLDTWDEARHGVPDSMPKIAFSLAPDAALRGYPCGTTGAPKGVMHNFGTLTSPSWGRGCPVSKTSAIRIE